MEPVIFDNGHMNATVKLTGFVITLNVDKI